MNKGKEGRREGGRGEKYRCTIAFVTFLYFRIVGVGALDVVRGSGGVGEGVLLGHCVVCLI